MKKAQIRIYKDRVEIWFQNIENELVFQSSYKYKDEFIYVQVFFEIEHMQNLGYKINFVNYVN